MSTDARALSHAARASSEDTIISAVEAAPFDNQSHSSPNLKGDCGTTRSQVGHAHRNLNALVNQRFAVVRHAEGVNLRDEVPASRVVAGEVIVSNYGQFPYARIHEPGEVEAWGEAVAITKFDQLRTLETELEVRAQQLLDRRGV